jgi:MFS family permease
MDRFGSRWILLAGNIGLAAGIVLVSRSSASIADFYWRFAVAGLFGTMAATGMVSKIVSDWFDARRGLMLGITAGVGNGVGATIMPILAGVLLTFYGWRTAYLVIGLVVLLAAPFIAFWLREAPPHTSQGPQDRAGRRAAPGRGGAHPRVLADAGGDCRRGGRDDGDVHPCRPAAHRPRGKPRRSDRGGGDLRARHCRVAGRHRRPARPLAHPRLILPMYASAIAGMLMLQFLTGSVAILGAGVLLGIGMGAEYGALSYFVSRYFGLRHFGAIVGVFYAVVAFIQGVAPALMDVSFDHSGTYAIATLTIVGALVLGMVLLALLPHPDRMEPVQTAIPAQTATDSRRAARWPFPWIGTASMSLVVFGSINCDVVMRVAHLPRPGETLCAQSHDLLPGGKGANQATAAALQGCRRSCWARWARMPMARRCWPRWRWPGSIPPRFPMCPARPGWPMSSWAKTAKTRS